jgi:hypothetical protein
MKLFLVFLLLASPAAAQTPPPLPASAYRIEVFLNATEMTANRALATGDIPATDVTCDQPPTSGAPEPVFDVNPDGQARLVWDDPDHVGRTCTTGNITGTLVKVLEKERAGTYVWRARAIGPVSDPVVAVTALRRPAMVACQPPPGKALPLAVTVLTSYPMTAPARNAQLRVDWRISNVRRVVYAQVLLNNVEVARMSGEDLARSTGLWFTGPGAAGDYNLTVFVRDVAGCDYRSGATRVVRVP